MVAALGKTGPFARGLRRHDQLQNSTHRWISNDDAKGKNAQQRRAGLVLRRVVMRSAMRAMRVASCAPLGSASADFGEREIHRFDQSGRRRPRANRPA
jgi:hypothetical protein